MRSAARASSSERGRVASAFEWQAQEQYAIALRTNGQTEALRQFARDTWGAASTQAVLGF